MDTVTQGLLGAVIGQAGFRRRIGPETSWVTAGMAILPDLDVFIEPVLGLTGIERGYFQSYVTHRGISHSLFMVPIISAVAAAIWWWLKKRKAARAPTQSTPVSFGIIYLATFLSLLSAPLLDLFTTWGTQLLAPLSRERFALDAVPIVDLIYSPVLIVTLVTCAVVRRKGKKVSGQDARNRQPARIAQAALILTTSYLLTGVVLHQRAIHAGRRSYQAQFGTEDVVVNAYPRIPTIFVWRITAATETRWAAGHYNFLRQAEPGQMAWNNAGHVENDYVRRALELEDVKIFQWFTAGQLRARFYHQDGLHIVEFDDMRYGLDSDSLESLWAARVVFAPGGEVSVEHISRGRKGGFSQMAKEAFQALGRK